MGQLQLYTKYVTNRPGRQPLLFIAVFHACLRNIWSEFHTCSWWHTLRVSSPTLTLQNRVWKGLCAEHFGRFLSPLIISFPCLRVLYWTYNVCATAPLARLNTVVFHVTTIFQLLHVQPPSFVGAGKLQHKINRHWIDEPMFLLTTVVQLHRVHCNIL